MKLLIVLSEKQRASGANSLLVRKSAALANGLGATLEFLHVVYDRSLELSMFLKKERLAAAREGILADELRWVGAIVDALKAQGLSVSCDVRWDHPRGAAVIRKLGEGDYDWVLKEAGNDRILLGLWSNTDWELLRDSPVPVYFVKGANPPGAGVLVALEGFAADEGSDQAALDYDIFRHGRRMAETFDAPLTVAHAYRIPTGLRGYVGYTPLLADTPVPADLLSSLTEDERHERHDVAERHGRAIRAFAEYFNYPVADIVIREGAPDLVISDEAHRRQSGLVVMGANEIGALDRLFRKVTAEPTLAEADCDILFVKRPTSARVVQPVADLQRKTRRAADEPREFSRLLANPAAHFEIPEAVLDDERFSSYQQRRILRAWERNTLRAMAVEDQANLGPETPELDGVRAALRALRHR